MSENKKIGIYAGSFDPLTLGHLDIIERSSKMFDEVIVLLAVNTSKKYLFSEAERLYLAKEVTAHLPNVKIDVLKNGLVADYYRQRQAAAMIRGVRTTFDFDYESNIAVVNRKQNPELDTVVLFADERYRYLSSSIIKEIATFKGDITEMVPPQVAEAMQGKY